MNNIIAAAAPFAVDITTHMFNILTFIAQYLGSFNE